jgi:uncharacterized membrane protein (Fun14 family)
MSAQPHSEPHTHPAGDPPDTLGQVLSAVCAVHCVTTPVLVTVAPAAGSVLGGAHPVLLVLVIAVALWAFVPGYRCHRNAAVVALALGGIAFLALAALALEGNVVAETLLSLVGAALMMAAHYRNRVLLRAAHAH